jgi:hypothetical protein
MITYTTVTNPQYTDASLNLVTMQVKFDHLPEIVEFVASPIDAELHGRELFTKATTGEFGTIAGFIPLTPTI